MDIKRVIKGTPEFDLLHSFAATWWKDWKWPVVPVESLPSNMLCAYNETGPICIGFLYITDSSVAILEWIVANQKSSKADRAQAIETIITTAPVLAEMIGCTQVFTFCKNESLSKKFEKHYTKTDEGMTHFMWNQGG